jgi:hypothetical protein
LAVVVVIGAAAILTAGRFDPPVSTPDAAEAHGTPRAALGHVPSGRKALAPSDRGAEQMARVLRFLTHAEVTDDADDNADVEERLRMAQQLAPVFPDRGQADVPDDLPLGEGWTVLFSIPAAAAGADDSLLLIRAPGQLLSVVELVRNQSLRDGWTAEVRQADGDDSLTLVLRRNRAARFVTVRPRGGDTDECIIAVWDAPR